MSILRKSKQRRELTVPIAVAHFGIARALRVYRKARKERFLAALVIPDIASYVLYDKAANRFLEKTNGLGEESNFALEEVQHVSVGMTAPQIEKILSKTTKRAVILFDDEKLLSDEVRLAADVCLVIPPPPPAYFRAAVHSVLNAPLSWSDALYLSSVPSSHLHLAFINNRSPKDALKRIRALPKVDSLTDQQGVEKGPTLHELAGYGDAKAWGIELARDLEEWREGRIDWSDVDRGILLSGPPGTGKTMFATALARTCRVSIVYCSAAKWQSLGHLGEMLAGMWAAFTKAKAKSPCILLVDEIDSFGDRKKADQYDSDYRRQVVNGFLECLDGSEGREGVVVVGATNYPDQVDVAIRRPSRLGRHVRIMLPADEDRIAIMEHHAEIKLSGEVQSEFVRATRGHTGDDIGQIARDAKRLARRDDRMLSEKDILAKLPVMHDIPLTHLRQAAIHEIGHAIIAVLLDGATITGIEIDTKAISGLDRQMVGTAMIDRRPGRRHDRAYYDDNIAVLLAGVAAEELVLGAYSDSGAGDDGADLVRATNLATAVEGCLGMGESLAAETWTDSRSLEAMRMRDPSLRKRVDAVLRTQFDRAKQLLSNNLSLLNRLTDELLEAKRLEGPYVDELVRTFGESRRLH